MHWMLTLNDTHAHVMDWLCEWPHWIFGGLSNSHTARSDILMIGAIKCKHQGSIVVGWRIASYWCRCAGWSNWTRKACADVFVELSELSAAQVVLVCCYSYCNGKPLRLVNDKSSIYRLSSLVVSILIWACSLSLDKWSFFASLGPRYQDDIILDNDNVMIDLTFEHRNELAGKRTWFEIHIDKSSLFKLCLVQDITISQIPKTKNDDDTI